MPYPHNIRLRGPWQFEVLDCSARDASRSGVAKLPSDWGSELGTAFRGRVRYTRRFGRPDGLDPHERVWLVCEGADPRGEVMVNGRHLGHVAGYALPWRHDVTNLLDARNTVAITIDFPAGAAGDSLLRSGREHLPGGPVGEVRLEILSTHSIDRLWLDVRDDGSQAELVGGGVVAGAPVDRPLELVIRGQAREVVYAEVQPGKPFEVSAPVDDLPLWSSETDGVPTEELSIKLLHGGSSVWEQTRLVGRRQVMWNARTRTLSIAGRDVNLPLDLVTATGDQSTSQSPHNAVQYSPRIMPNAWYDHLDKTVQPVVQQVPLAWSDEVCPRLAHHPSIIAWTASRSEANSLGPQKSAALLGRPWIVREPATERLDTGA